MKVSHSAPDRCHLHLLTLRQQIRHGDPGFRSATTVSHVIGSVIREVEAAVGTGVMLQGRVSRLRAAGDAVIAAAGYGTDAGLRRELSRFEALTAAIWVVRDGLEPAMGGRYEHDSRGL